MMTKKLPYSLTSINSIKISISLCLKLCRRFLYLCLSYLIGKLQTLLNLDNCSIKKILTS